MLKSIEIPPYIVAAAERLRAGELVAFPTETVYGLGADATNPSAVAKIFALKGRPSTNPLIVHVADAKIAQRYTTSWDDRAAALAEAFWPGPLTIVLRKADSIVSTVTAGGETVGLRVPAHAIALQLLQAFGGAVAAPSANRSNHVSPTCAAHVLEEFGPVAPLIIDGGQCFIGIESTVIDLTSEPWQILRPGTITAEAIAGVIGPGISPLPLREGSGAGVLGSSREHGAQESNSTLVPPTPPSPARGEGEILRSPGQLLTHYAPRTPAFRFEAAERSSLDLQDAAIVELTLDPHTYARNFYARLRLLDTQDLRAIYIEIPPDTEAWRAVRDRVLRATRPLEDDDA